MNEYEYFYIRNIKIWYTLVKNVNESKTIFNLRKKTFSSHKNTIKPKIKLKLQTIPRLFSNPILIEYGCLMSKT